MLFLIGRWVGAFRVRSLTILASLLLSIDAAQAATPPAVEFDLPPTTVCRAVTASDVVRQHPGMNLVEVAFDLSTRMIAGSETDIKHITVEIKSPDRQLLLVGFSPATTLLSESSSGFIEIEEHRASGQIAIEYGIPNAKVQASAKNAGDSKIVEKKLAPKSLLVSATTIDRSHGVIFKLLPSNQDSLQKSRQFVCQFAVPSTFRGDYVQLTCTAVGTNRGAMRSLDTEVVAGTARYTVGIYRDGDAAARRAADVLAQRQETLGAWCCGKPIRPGRRNRLPGGTPSARRFGVHRMRRRTKPRAKPPPTSWPRWPPASRKRSGRFAASTACRTQIDPTRAGCQAARVVKRNAPNCRSSLEWFDSLRRSNASAGFEMASAPSRHPGDRPPGP